MRKKRPTSVLTVIIYAMCIFLAVPSVLPSRIMFMNATGSTTEIQQHATAFLPSTHTMKNLGILLGKSFNPAVGFMNSLLISAGVTACAVYFSIMTAYGLIVYSRRFRKSFLSFTMAIMTVPVQVTTIGFHQMAYRIHMTNYLAMLILPAIASPPMVFFMRQHMLPVLFMEITQAARIDGAGEFYIFNKVALPVMKPATATQAIFSFVTSWNNLFTPLVLLMDKSKYTMSIIVSLLRGDIYKTEHGSAYPGLVFTVSSLTVVYLLLSKYIIAGVALGGVKGQAIVTAGLELGALR